jgi:hypothetical protein
MHIYIYIYIYMLEHGQVSVRASHLLHTCRPLQTGTLLRVNFLSEQSCRILPTFGKTILPALSSSTMKMEAALLIQKLAYFH